MTLLNPAQRNPEQFRTINPRKEHSYEQGIPNAAMLGVVPALLCAYCLDLYLQTGVLQEPKLEPAVLFPSFYPDTERAGFPQFSYVACANCRPL